MLRINRRVAPAVLALALYAGAVACGGSDDPAPGSQSSPTPTPSATSTAPGSEPVPSPSGTATGTTAGTPGLAEDFPEDDVPLIPGVVTGKSGGDGPDGRRGWIFELSSSGSQKECFDKAAAVLVAAGFTKQGEITAADTRQAQFTTAEYAVVISARADGDEFCQVGYEVGQVSK